MLRASLSILCECSTRCWIPLLKTGDGAKIQVLQPSHLVLCWLSGLVSLTSYESEWEFQSGNITIKHGCSYIPSPPPRLLDQISLSLQMQLKPNGVNSKTSWLDPDPPLVGLLKAGNAVELTQVTHQFTFLSFPWADRESWISYFFLWTLASWTEVKYVKLGLNYRKKMSCISTFSSSRVTI